MPELVEPHLLPVHILLIKDGLLADGAGLPVEEDEGFLDAKVTKPEKRAF